MEADDAAWAAWFRADGLRPAAMLYEDLARDPVGATSALIACLGLSGAGPLAFGNRRLADAESQEWIERFRDGGCLTPPAQSGPS